MLEFLLLRHVKRVIGAPVISAGVDAALVEPQAKEIVIDVVMVTDRLAVEQAGMPHPPAQMKISAILRHRCLAQGLADAHQFVRIALDIYFLLDIMAGKFAHAGIDECSEGFRRAHRDVQTRRLQRHQR